MTVSPIPIGSQIGLDGVGVRLDGTAMLAYLRQRTNCPVSPRQVRHRQGHGGGELKEEVSSTWYRVEFRNGHEDIKKWL